MLQTGSISKELVIGISIALLVVIGTTVWYVKKSKAAQAQKTLAIIKPDAVQAGASGKIIEKIEQNGFKIVAMKKIQLTKEKAEEFYAVHKDKPFFNDLVKFMTSDQIIAMVLEKVNAIQSWRDLMGSTNPATAEPGTLRKEFGTSIERNAVHGSDAPQTAEIEIKIIFPEL